MKKHLPRVVVLLVFFLFFPVVIALARWISPHGSQISFGKSLLLGAYFAGMLLVFMTIELIFSRFFLAGTEELKAAYVAVLIGQTEEAERLLATLDPRRADAFRRRHAALIRATIHYQRGEVDQALVAADVAIDGPTALLERAEMKVLMPSARGLRALLRAVKGDEVGARADIVVARSEAADCQAKARAALAEGMLLDRAGDGDQARAHLARERGLLFEGLSPGERAIARGLLRKAIGVPASVYRRKAGEPARGEKNISQWAAQLAPGATAFMAPPRAALLTTAAPATSEPAASESARASAAVVRELRVPFEAAAREGRMTRAALLVMLGGVPGILGLERLVPTLRGWPSGLMLALFGVLVVAVYGFSIRQWVRTKRHTRVLSAAEQRLVRGDVEGLGAVFIELAALPDRNLAAIAECHMAALALHEGDLQAALAACDRCLGHVAALRDAAAASTKLFSAVSTLTGQQCARVVAMVDPRVAALRASVLAAMGRAEEAAVEVELIPEGQRAVTLDRVRIFRHLRIGDLAGAAQVVAHRPPGLHIDLRDEALSDLVVAAVSADDGELAALQDEIASDPSTERWLRGVAPELLVRRAAEAPR